MRYLRPSAAVDGSLRLWHCLHALCFPLLSLREEFPQSVYRVANFDSDERQTLPGTFSRELDEGLHLRVFHDIGPDRNYCVEIKLPEEIGATRPVIDAVADKPIPPAAVTQATADYVRMLFRRAIAPELSSSGDREFRPVVVHLPTMAHSVQKLAAAYNQWEISSPAHFMIEGPYLPGVSERTIAGTTLQTILSIVMTERRQLSQGLARPANAFKGIGIPLYGERITVETEASNSKPASHALGDSYTITDHPFEQLLEERRWRFGVVDDVE